MSFMAFLQIAGAVKQYGDSQSAASDMKEAGEKNAQLGELETKERLRRSGISMSKSRGKELFLMLKLALILAVFPLSQLWQKPPMLQKGR